MSCLVRLYFPPDQRVFQRVLREKKREKGEREGNGGGEMAERRGIKGMDKWREGREGVDARLKI